MSITRKALAAALGVSPAAVTKQAKRGMPTDSVDRARRWRDRHLDPARTVAGRVDYQGARAVRAAPVEAVHADASDIALARVQALGVAAFDELLERGNIPGSLEAELRAALRTISARRRGEVALELRVWDALTVQLRRLAQEIDRELQNVGEDAPPVDTASAVPADDDTFVGHYLYLAAAGLLAIDEAPARSGGHPN